MAVSDDVRIAIRDYSAPQRYSDIEVLSVMGDALNEVNVWCKTTFTLANLNSPPTTMPSYFLPLFMLVAKLKFTAADMSDLDRYAKFVTQDAQYDPGNLQQTLTRIYWNLRNEITDKLKMWGVVGQGAVVAFQGEQVGGGTS